MCWCCDIMELRREQGLLMISSTVWAVGALRLTSMARMPNSRIWMVAPAAYLEAHVSAPRSRMTKAHAAQAMTHGPGQRL